MRKLQRGPAPACLSLYRHGLNNWKALTADNREEIWVSLEAMQQQRCAYCEGELRIGKRHIEHFRQRDRYTRLTFIWSNLFGSCNQDDSCGKYKDELPRYDPASLIKPDDEDPEHFFLFISDGNIVVREGLSIMEKQRANETIRIFNLNGVLRARRHIAVSGYLSLAKEVQQLVDSGDFTLAQGNEVLKDELIAIAHLPFSTAIRHVLTAA